MPEEKSKKPKKEPVTDPENESEDSETEQSDKKKESFKPKAKPELSDSEVAQLKLRAHKKSKTPHFKRQEWFRYQKLGDKWRKPRGLHSKMRRHISYRTNVVSIGYRGPKSVRGLHPSGFREVMVYNLGDMEGLDPKKQAIRIGHSVGYLKRIHIAMLADDMGLRILNFGRGIQEDLLAEAKKRDIELPAKYAREKKKASSGAKPSGKNKEANQ